MCLSKYETITIPPCLKNISAQHRSKMLQFFNGNGDYLKIGERKKICNPLIVKKLDLCLRRKHTTKPCMSLHGFSILQLDCCAVNPVRGPTNDFDNTAWCTTSPGSCQTTSSEVPKTCCLGVTESTYSSAPATCHQNVDSGTYNSKVC